MSDSYTKLFSSITASTIWGEPYATRIVWVTMLAMADAQGAVYASVPGLARISNTTREETDLALLSMMQPDVDSRTPDHEGRRIEPIDGGWRLLNHAKFARIRDAQSRKEYMRDLMADKRAAEKQHGAVLADGPVSDSFSNVSNSVSSVSNVSSELANVSKLAAVSPTSTSTSTSTKDQEQKTAPKGEDLFPGIDPQIVADFKALRNKLRAPITKTALAGIQREADKAGLPLAAALAMCCERGWRGFKADWVSNATAYPPTDAPRARKPL